LDRDSYGEDAALAEHTSITERAVEQVG